MSCLNGTWFHDHHHNFVISIISVGKFHVWSHVVCILESKRAQITTRATNIIHMEEECYFKKHRVVKSK